MKKQELIHEKFKLSIHSSGDYYEVEVFSDVEFKIEDQKDFVKAQLQLGGKVLPVLITAGNHVTASVEYFKYVSKKENDPYTKADAFVTKSMVARILINFYLQVVKPERPSKLFNNKEDALKWIKSLK